MKKITSQAAVLFKGDWDESKHPRARDGKFGSGGGAARASEPLAAPVGSKWAHIGAAVGGVAVGAKGYRNVGWIVNRVVLPTARQALREQRIVGLSRRGGGVAAGVIGALAALGARAGREVGLGMDQRVEAAAKLKPGESIYDDEHYQNDAERPDSLGERGAGLAGGFYSTQAAYMEADRWLKQQAARFKPEAGKMIGLSRAGARFRIGAAVAGGLAGAFLAHGAANSADDYIAGTKNGVKQARDLGYPAAQTPVTPSGAMKKSDQARVPSGEGGGQFTSGAGAATAPAAPEAPKPAGWGTKVGRFGGGIYGALKGADVGAKWGVRAGGVAGGIAGGVAGGVVGAVGGTKIGGAIGGLFGKADLSEPTEMENEILGALLTKHVGDAKGLVRVIHASGDLAHLVTAIRSDDPAQSDAAFAALEKWTDGPDDLRKGLAQAWIARARATIDAGAAPEKEGDAAATGTPQTHPVIHKLRSICARKGLQ